MGFTSTTKAVCSTGSCAARASAPPPLLAFHVQRAEAFESLAFICQGLLLKHSLQALAGALLRILKRCHHREEYTRQACLFFHDFALEQTAN